jgi:hypothetical protein
MKDTKEGMKDERGNTKKEGSKEGYHGGEEGRNDTTDRRIPRKEGYQGKNGKEGKQDVVLPVTPSHSQNFPFRPSFPPSPISLSVCEIIYG